MNYELNYNTKKANSQEYWLYFSCYGDGEELCEAKIPTPNYYHRTDENRYSVAWGINGYFGTKKGREYVNDVVARLSLQIPIFKRYHFVPNYTPSIQHRQKLELKQFQNLPSIKNARKLEEQPRATNQKIDEIFWAIKYEAVKRIKTLGHLDLDGLTAWAFDLFEHKAKDRSTLKAKCKNVYEWYEVRDFKVEGRIHTTTRAEAAAKATTARQERVKAKIQGAVNILLLYGKKITAEAIAEEAKISRTTAQKYVKLLNLKKV